MTRLCVASDLGRMLLIPIVTARAAAASPRGDEASSPVGPSVRREDEAVCTHLVRRDIDVTSERDSE
jgi:hypothetical protein